MVDTVDIKQAFYSLMEDVKAQHKESFQCNTIQMSSHKLSESTFAERGSQSFKIESFTYTFPSKLY